MGMESFKPFKKIKEDIADKIDDINDAIKIRKDEKNEERVAEAWATWKSGPVEVGVEPASFSEIVDVTKLTSKEDFEKKYPALCKAVGEERRSFVSPLVIARIDIAAKKKTENGEMVDYAQDKNLVFAGMDLKNDVIRSLKEFAQLIKEGKEPFDKIDYLMGVSRLGNAAGHFGFDTYPFAEDVERDHRSHKLSEAANILAGMDKETAAAKARKRPATLAVMSTKKFLEMYGD